MVKQGDCCELNFVTIHFFIHFSIPHFSVHRFLLSFPISSLSQARIPLTFGHLVLSMLLSVVFALTSYSQAIHKVLRDCDNNMRQ